MWKDFFRDGGWGMYPTLSFGLLLLACAAVYVARPDRRLWPILACATVLALASGTLGFFTGLNNTLRYAATAPDGDRVPLAMIGIAESSHNLILALIGVVLAALTVTLGAVRSARAQPAVAR